MRIDRLISIVLYRLLGFGTNFKIPILMYHSVTPVLEKIKHPYFSIETTPETFDRQLKYLKDNSYNIIKLSDLLTSSIEKREKCLVLTFDDGYNDFYEYALPLLKLYQIPATVFIPSGIIKSSSRIFKEKKLMSWRQIKECTSYGIEFGSHSLTHTSLTNLSMVELEYELCESKKIIENELNEVVDLFSYPYRFPEENSDFVNNLIRLLKKCGYRQAVTTRIGRSSPTDDRMKLKRIPVNEYDDESLFNAKIVGAYDWLYYFQYISKKMRI